MAVKEAKAGDFSRTKTGLHQHAPLWCRAVVLIACTLGTLFCVSNCTSIKGMFGIGTRQPTVTIVAINLTKAALDGIELAIDVKVHNPNGFDLKLNKLDYQVTMLGQKVASGSLEREIAIKSEADGVITIPMKLDSAAIFVVFKEYLRDPQKLTAKVVGEGRFVTAFGSWTIPFAHETKIMQLPGGAAP